MSLEFSEELTSPIISPTFAPQDAGEIGLRPKLLSDYTGQEKAKDNLSVYIEAARRRNEPLDHTLLYGPPGLGKPLWQVLSPTKWVSISALLPALPSKNPAIWRHC